MKIAICSSNGIDVDLHFGQGSSLYIYNYDIDKNTTSFIEKRDVKIIKDKKHQWPKVLDKIKDCDVIIAVQFGFKSKMGIDEEGLKVFEYEGKLKKSLNNYIDHYKFMKTPI